MNLTDSPVVGRGTAGRIVFRLGLGSLILALLCYVFIWSGGLVALPLAWLLALVAVLIYPARRATQHKGAAGVVLALIVLADAAVELVRFAIR